MHSHWLSARGAFKLLAVILLVLFVGFLRRNSIERRLEAARGDLRALGYPATWAELDASYRAKSTPDDAGPIYREAFARYHDEDSKDLPIVGDTETPYAGIQLTESMAAKVKAYLAANADALAKLREATAKGRAQFPLYSPVDYDKLDEDLDIMKNLRQAARLFALDALAAEFEGDVERQLGDIKSCVQVATHRCEAPNDIKLLVGLAIEGIGMEAAARPLCTRDVSPNTVATLRDIVAERDGVELLRQAFRGESAGWIENLARIGRVPQAAGQSLLEDTGYFSEDLIEGISEKFPPLLSGLGLLGNSLGILKQQELQIVRDTVLYAPYYQAPLSQILNTPPPTLSGGMLSTMSFGVQEGIPPAVANTVVREKLLRAACTLKAHQLATGSYPTELAELKEESARGEFEDLFAGAPFHYVLEGASVKLYSLGRNRVDDGGNDKRQADIVISF